MTCRPINTSDLKRKSASELNPQNKENQYLPCTSSSKPSQPTKYHFDTSHSTKQFDTRGKLNPNNNNSSSNYFVTLNSSSKTNLAQILRESSRSTQLHEKISDSTAKNQSKRNNSKGLSIRVEDQALRTKTDTENLQDRSVFLNILKERAQASKEKQNRIRKQSESEEMKECYFSPKINRDPNQVEVRSLNLFLQDQSNYEEHKRVKKNNLIQELSLKQAKDLTLIPQINQQSSFRNTSIPIHERLYSLTRDTLKTTSETQTFATSSTKALMTSEGSSSNSSSRLFSPSICHKSQIMQRNQPIDVLLYSDAKRRQDKQINSQKEIPVEQISLNERSESVYTGTFVRLFESAWTAARKQGANTDESTIDYLETSNVLAQLLFVSQIVDLQSDKATNMNVARERSLIYDLWVNLKGNQFNGISKRNLLSFLFAVQGIKVSGYSALKESIDTFSERQHKNISNKNEVQQLYQSQQTQPPKQHDCEFGYFVGETWFVGDDSKNIQRKYDLLIKTRLNQQKIRNVSPKQIREMSQSQQQYVRFQSNNLSLSQSFANKHVHIDLTKRQQSPLARFELLVTQKNMQKKRHATMKELHAEKQLEGCSFQPNLDRCSERIKSNPKIGIEKSLSLFTINAKPSSQRRDKATFDLEYEKYCDECTFHPDISLTQNSVASSQRRQNSSRGHNTSQDRFFEKTVHRMRKARQDSHNTSVLLQRGYNNTPLYSIFSTSQDKHTKHSQSSTNCFKSFDEINHQNNCEKQPGQMNTMTSDGGQAPSSLWTEEDILQEGSSSRVVTYQSERRNPILFVDVNIDQNSSERIVIYEGDDVNLLAQEFAQVHNLDQNTQEKLKNMLMQQMTNYLERQNQIAQNI